MSTTKQRSQVPMHPNNLGVFDDNPSDTKRKVAESMFVKGLDYAKIARAVGARESEVRAWYEAWYARQRREQR